MYEAMFRDVDGVQRARRLEARSERAAVRETRRLLAAREDSERVVAADVTLREFWLDEFLPLAESLAAADRRSEQGVELDRNHWRLYVEPHLGDLRLGDVNGADIAAMLRAGRTRRPKPLSESTQKHSLTVVGALYRLARTRRGSDGRPLVTRSPLDELDPAERPRPRTRKKHRLDERELDLLVRHAPQPYRVAVALLAHTGIRVSEACGLRWADVDFVDLELAVGGQLTRARRGRPARVVPRKSGADAYEALLFPALERVLVEHLAGEQRAGRGSDDDFVLATRTGRPLSQRNVARAVTDAGASATRRRSTSSSRVAESSRRSLPSTATGTGRPTSTLKPARCADTALTFRPRRPGVGYFGLRQNISFCSHFLIIGAPRFELGTSSPPD